MQTNLIWYCSAFLYHRSFLFVRKVTLATCDRPVASVDTVLVLPVDGKVGQCPLRNISRNTHLTFYVKNDIQSC